jgi:alpha-L-fucosidase
MKMTRRTAMGLFAAAAAARGQEPKPEIAPGPFQATKQSLDKYTCPEWFRDAKFGLWAHWGPSSAIGAGDWYARNSDSATDFRGLPRHLILLLF